MTLYVAFDCLFALGCLIVAAIVGTDCGDLDPMLVDRGRLYRPAGRYEDFDRHADLGGCEMYPDRTPDLTAEPPLDDAPHPAKNTRAAEPTSQINFKEN